MFNLYLIQISHKTRTNLKGETECKSQIEILSWLKRRISDQIEGPYNRSMFYVFFINNARQENTRYLMVTFNQMSHTDLTHLTHELSTYPRV